MDLGGFCASGGPYEIAVECPDAVVATTPLSIFGGFLSAGLMLWGGAALGGSWISLVFLAWPALFLTLGWNFLAYGFFPPEGGWVWSWIVCGVLFVLMGGVPAHRGDRRGPRRVGWQPGVRIRAGGRAAAADRLHAQRAGTRSDARTRHLPTPSSTDSNASRRCAAGVTSRPPSTRPPRPRRSPRREAAP